MQTLFQYEKATKKTNQNNHKGKITILEGGCLKNSFLSKLVFSLLRLSG
jgi:hypothetical protein